MSNDAPRFLTVPPGPVTDRTRVELRLAVPNIAGKTGPATVTFSADGEKLAERTVTPTAGKAALANAWLDTKGRAGKRRLRWRIEQAGRRTEEGEETLEIVSSPTPALPRLQGMWIESFAAIRHAESDKASAIERHIRDSVDAMSDLGVKTLIIAYVEYNATFFYPSEISFHDGDAKREARGRDCPFDVVGTVLSQADRRGMRVFLGLGRGGDTYLLWQFDKPGWAKRNADALDLAKRVAAELYARYRRHPSLYGWYFTHEMNDLARSSAYYDPLADFCHGLAPEMPVLVAPAGTPIITRDSLRASQVDIFAYQDAVGSGYVPYKNTFNPDQRIAMLDEVFTRYAKWHEGSDKHLWADLEIWEMDGSQGYGGAYPPTFERVRRQIEIEARYASHLTGYAWHGYMRRPESAGEPLPKAERLYRDYAAYRKKQPGR